MDKRWIFNSNMLFGFFMGLLAITGVTSQPVQWLEKPKSVSAREGDNVTFVCRLSTEDPNIIWDTGREDNSVILFVKNERWTPDPRFTVINKYDLVITNITRKDNANYACRPRDAGVQTASLTVLLRPGPPRITRDILGPEYAEGDVVTFTCSSTGGNPSPVITWLKNGNISTAPATYQEAQDVGGTASSSITVQMDKTDHQANYSCLVYNELTQNNKALDSIGLSVRYAPSIAFRPYYPKYTVRLGEDVEIICDVDANPRVDRVTWTKDGVTLAGNSPRRTLSPINLADHGNYTCTAKNEIGERSGSLQIDVQYRPVITIPPIVTQNEFDDVNVICQIEANPKPYEIQWVKISSDGSPRTIVNSEQLRISQIGRGGAGNYSCRAQSQLRVSGEAVQFVTSEAFMYLHVQYKPGRAVIGPVPEMDVGDRLDIVCTATPAGYPEASFVWTKNGSRLSTTTQTLTIPSVGLSDNGRYGCTPNNVRGSGEAAFVDVNVYEPPKIVKEPSSDLSVFLTSEAPITLTCIAEGYPEPRITWYQDGDNQPLNLRTDLFKVINLSQSVNSYSVRRESTLHFEGPGRELSSSGKRTLLQIRDLGNYSCQADSAKHSDAPLAKTQLFINFPPVLENTPPRVAASLHRKTELRCIAQAHPDPTFRWIFQGSQLSNRQPGISINESYIGGIGRMESRLTIRNVTERSYGTYSCRVENLIGNKTAAISLTGKSPPEQPNGLRSVSKSWESVLLTWMPGFDGGFDQKFYIHRSGGGEEAQRLEVRPYSATTFNVTKLRPSGTYTFQVVASNEMGFGPHSTAITVTTNNLQLPTLSDIPIYDAKQRKLILLPPQGNEYCLRVEVRSDRGEWNQVNGCMKVMGDTLEISHSSLTAVNVSVCLSHRTDVCSVPIAAEIRSTEKEPVLTEEIVIIIACVCGVIIITLLVILFCFICRRKRNAAKNYQQNTNQGDPPPYNAVAGAKKPQQVYDNQDGPLDLHTSPYPSTRAVRPEYNISLDRHIVDNEINHLRYYQNNNRMENYGNRDGQAVPRSPTKDKYIDLTERGGGGIDPMLNESGYNTGSAVSDPNGQMGGAGGKPKKLVPLFKRQRLKWRWHWRPSPHYIPPTPQFSHNPPGHTCGLPCCQPVDDSQQQHQQLLSQSQSRGCVRVPVFTSVELSESNFQMKPRPIPSSQSGYDLTQSGLLYADRGYKSEGDDADEDGGERSNGDAELDDDDGWISDHDELEEPKYDKFGNRIIRFTKNPHVLAPMASTELLAMKGPEALTRGEIFMPTFLRNRKHVTDQMRQRFVTLPDAPRTHHRMVFLNHAPGESSDSPDMNSLDFRSLRSMRGDTAEKKNHHRRGSSSSSLDIEEEVQTGTFKPKTPPKKAKYSEDEKAEPTNEDKIETSVPEIIETPSSDLKPAQGKNLRRRIVHSKLPPVPTEARATKNSPRTRRAVKNDLEVESIAEDNESVTDEYEDHVYDVVHDVKAESEKLNKIEVRDDEDDDDNPSPSQSYLDMLSPEKLCGSEPSGPEIQDTTNTMSEPAVMMQDLAPTLPTTSCSESRTVSDVESLTYQASVSDSNTESYIYNGSLLSQTIDDSDASNLYIPGPLVGNLRDSANSDEPAFILRQRYKNELNRRPMIFMMGGRPLVLPGSKPSESMDNLYNLSNSSVTTKSDRERKQSSSISDIDLQKFSVRIEKCGGANDTSGGESIGKSSTYKSYMDSLSEDSSYLDLATSGLEVDPSTKLKLWDLRLIQLNREENHYSTFPPRKPTVDDLSVGYFPRCPELGYRHRHNSDVSSDHYVAHKLFRMLRAPVLTQPSHIIAYNVTSTGTPSDSSWINAVTLNPYRNNSHLNLNTENVQNWREFFSEKQSDSRSLNINLEDFDINKDYDFKLPELKKPTSQWLDTDEEPIYEPITLSGIFNWERDERQAYYPGKYDTHLLHPDRQHVDSLLVRKRDRDQRKSFQAADPDRLSSNSEGAYSPGFYSTGSTYSGSPYSGSVYSGSVYGGSIGSVGSLHDKLNGTFNQNVTKNVHGSHNHNTNNNNNPQSKRKAEMERKKKKDTDRPVIWGDASVVDWRRQAELFRDKNFITLIL